MKELIIREGSDKAAQQHLEKYYLAFKTEISHTPSLDEILKDLITRATAPDFPIVLAPKKTLHIPPKSFVYGPYTFYPELDLFTENSRSYHVGGPQNIILSELMKEPRNLRTNSDLMQALGYKIDKSSDSNIKMIIFRLRKDIGDNPPGPHSMGGKFSVIKTIPTKGYVFDPEIN